MRFRKEKTESNRNRYLAQLAIREQDTDVVSLGAVSKLIKSRARLHCRTHKTIYIYMHERYIMDTKRMCSTYSDNDEAGYNGQTGEDKSQSWKQVARNPAACLCLTTADSRLLIDNTVYILGLGYQQWPSLLLIDEFGLFSFHLPSQYCLFQVNNISDCASFTIRERE